MSEEDKIAKIESHFREIMLTLGLDLNDDSFTWRLTARYAPNAVTSIYANYARGRRSEVLSALPPGPAWQAQASNVAHWALYALFFAVPLSGWAYSSMAGFPTVLFGVLPGKAVAGVVGAITLMFLAQRLFREPTI